MNKNDTGIVVRFWDEVFNSGKLDVIDDLFAADYLLHDLATKKDLDREQLKGVLSAVQSEIYGCKAIIDDQFEAEGNRHVTRVTFRVPRPADTTADKSEPADA